MGNLLINEPFRNAVINSLKNKNLFWSYDLVDNRDLPDSVLIEVIMKYGDLHELAGLPYLFPENRLKEELNRLIVEEKFQQELLFVSNFLFNSKIK